MKRQTITFVFSLALMAGLASLSSCKDDDDNKCYICEDPSGSNSSTVEFCDGDGIEKADIESNGFTCTEL